jgi:hypothetical protein
MVSPEFTYWLPVVAEREYALKLMKEKSYKEFLFMEFIILIGIISSIFTCTYIGGLIGRKKGR